MRAKASLRSLRSFALFAILKKILPGRREGREEIFAFQPFAAETMHVYVEPVDDQQRRIRVVRGIELSA